MIVFIESNFPLELARQQEEAKAVEDILHLAESGKIRLVLPALSIYEPFSTIARYKSDRNRFVNELQVQLKELGRIQSHKELTARLQTLPPTLLELEKTEVEKLLSTVARILRVAKVVHITPKILTRARGLMAKSGLSAQDAIVFACIVATSRNHARAIPKCFLSRNPKDFDKPKLIKELKSANCRYIAKFQDGLSFIQNSLGTV